ncbi:MAG TPA: EF-hand domain-containing protein [Rudaea sp.]|nr:EF-hand domain-containing protein [Rudaea sp.]
MSRKLMLAILTALPLAGGSICATAHDAASTAAAGARPSFFQHMLQAMDTNGDGKISLDEYLAAATKRFQSIDTQNKGSIDAADIAASPQTVQRDQKMAQRFVTHMDTAGNGYVSKDEFLAAASTRFAKMDSTGTGQVTPSQFEAAAPGGRGHWHGAAAPSGKHAQFAQDMTQREFGKLDANQDGVVGKDEYLAAAGTRFDALDTAHTGKLTVQEIAASPKMLRRDEFAAQRELRHMGAGADGRVTQDQYLAAAKARFAKLDANGDGFIEADEANGHRWARSGTKPAASNRIRF